MQGRWRAVGIFLVLAFGLSWTVAFTFGGDNPLALQTMALAFGMGPAAAALLTQATILGRPVPGPLGLAFEPSRWVLGAWGAPFLLALVVFGLGAMLPHGGSISFDPRVHFEHSVATLPPESLPSAEDIARMREQFDQDGSGFALFPLLAKAVGGLFFSATLGMFFALGQELGWRGFLLRYLAPLGFWRASLLTGLVAGLWAAPLVRFGIYFSTYRDEGVLLTVAFALLLAPLASFLRLSGGGVVAPALFASGLTAMTAFAAGYFVGADERLVGFTGAAGLVVLLLANAWLRVRGVAEAEQALREIAAEG